MGRLSATLDGASASGFALRERIERAQPPVDGSSAASRLQSLARYGLDLSAGVLLVHGPHCHRTRSNAVLLFHLAACQRTCVEPYCRYVDAIAQYSDGRGTRALTSRCAEHSLTSPDTQDGRGTPDVPMTGARRFVGTIGRNRPPCDMRHVRSNRGYAAIRTHY